MLGIRRSGRDQGILDHLQRLVQFLPGSSLWHAQELFEVVDGGTALCALS